MSEIRILNLCHKKSILVDIYRQSLLTAFQKKTYIIDYINYTLFGTKIAGSI